MKRTRKQNRPEPVRRSGRKAAKKQSAQARIRALMARERALEQRVKELREQRAESRTSAELLSIVKERLESALLDLRGEMQPYEEAISQLDDLDLPEDEE